MTAKRSCLIEGACVLECASPLALFFQRLPSFAPLRLCVRHSGLRRLPKPFEAFPNLPKAKINNPFFLFGRFGTGLPRRSPALRDEGGSNPVKVSQAESRPVKALLKTI